MSEGSDSGLNAGLQAHAKARSMEITQKVRVAIAAIEKDIDENEGIYPYNKARVTKNEICRRAGINPMTLQAPKHKDTTGALVDAFIERLNTETVTGRRSVRKTVTERADTWKLMHEQIANHYQLAKLEMTKQNLQVKQLAKRVKELEAENAELKQQLTLTSGENVTPFPKRGP